MHAVDGDNSKRYNSMGFAGTCVETDIVSK